MDWNKFFYLNKSKLLIVVILFVTTFILGVTASSLSDSSTAVAWGAAIFFPLLIAGLFEERFATTVQDVRTCNFEGCDILITVFAIVSSLVAYFLLASLIYHLFVARKKKEFNI